MLKKFLSCVIAAFLVVGVIPLTVSAENTSYEKYIKKNKEITKDVTGFSVSATEDNVALSEGAIFVSGEEYGRSGVVLYTQEQSEINWKINVPSTGLYNISLEYFPVEGRGQSIRRVLLIDGVLPFEEAASFNFSRVWTDENEIKQDTLGNDLYTNQVQKPEWRTEYFDDSNAFYNEPFLFNLSAGEHTLTISALEEPLVISKINFEKDTELLSYVDAFKKYKAEGYDEVESFEEKIQAEAPIKKSSPSLSAVADRSDPSVEPSDIYATKLNTIGGGRFSTGGMWIEYSVNAPETGLYQITFKAKQNNGKDQSAYRNIYINGKAQYKEALNFPFHYSAKYKNVIFGDENGAYRVLLNKGENTICIEAALGDISNFCNDLEHSM